VISVVTLRLGKGEKMVKHSASFAEGEMFKKEEGKLKIN